MPRKESEAAPEGIGTVPQQVGSGEPALEDEIWMKREDLLKTMVDGRLDGIEESVFSQPGT